VWRLAGHCCSPRIKLIHRAGPRQVAELRRVVARTSGTREAHRLKLIASGRALRDEDGAASLAEGAALLAVTAPLPPPQAAQAQADAPAAERVCAPAPFARGLCTGRQASLAGAHAPSLHMLWHGGAPVVEPRPSRKHSHLCQEERCSPAETQAARRTEHQGGSSHGAGRQQMSLFAGGTGAAGAILESPTHTRVLSCGRLRATCISDAEANRAGSKPGTELTPAQDADAVRFELPADASPWARRAAAFCQQRLHLPELLMVVLFSVQPWVWCAAAAWLAGAPIAHRLEVRAGASGLCEHT